jgi:hypothetical protein
MIGYAKLALTALEASGLLTKILIGLGLLAAALTAYGIWHHEVYREGYTRALADIAAEDSRAIARATQFRQTWRECRDRGGRWDQSKGTCS